MKKSIIFTLILSSLSFAFGDWLHMVKTGSQKINYSYARCFYKQNYGDFSVSIVVKGGAYSCPYSIQYNPLNNQWK